MAKLKTTYVSGNLFVTGSETFVSASQFIGNLTGTASVAENLDPDADLRVKTLDVSGSAVVGGDLKVMGDLTYVGVKDLRVKDKTIELNTDDSGSAVASADGAGIIIKNSDPEGDISILYDKNTDSLIINKPFSGSVAEATKVKFSLKIGSGFEESGSSFDGHEEVNITLDDEYVKNLKIKEAIKADHADSASRADSAAVADSVSDPIWIRGTGSGSAVLSGSSARASGQFAVAEGFYTIASGNYSHAEGSATIASGTGSHAEGSSTLASGNFSHAEGSETEASGNYSHVEGANTKASGEGSHAEGRSTKALGNYSHAEGNGTIASNDYEHAQGKYNATASGQIFSIGCGDTYAREKNAVSVITGSNPSASVYIYGIGGYDGTNPTPGTNDLAAASQSISSSIATLASASNAALSELSSSVATDFSASDAARVALSESVASSSAAFSASVAADFETIKSGSEEALEQFSASVASDFSASNAHVEEVSSSLSSSINALSSSVDSTYVKKAGDTMTGALNMGNNAIQLGDMKLVWNATEQAITFVVEE